MNVVVEMRFGGKALTYKEGPNFRDPATLFCPVEVDKVWCSMARKFRLTKPTHAKKRACETDKRWLPVMEGTHETFEQRLTEDRAPKDGAYRWRRQRNMRQLVDASARLMALHGLAVPKTRSQWAAQILQAAEMENEDVMNRVRNRMTVYGAQAAMWFEPEILAMRARRGQTRKYRMRRAA